MKVIFYDTKPFEKKYLEEKLKNDFETVFYPNGISPATVIDDKIKDAEIISCFIDSDLGEKTLDRFPNLKFIVLRSVGYSHVDLACCKERGINIFNAPHYGDYSIAEYTFAILLSAVRKIPRAFSDVKNQNTEDINYQGIELCGKTIGIVGLGAIGEKVYEIAKSFSMNPVYYDVRKKDGYNFVPIDELCKISDVISINCNLNQNTLYLFDDNRFKIMKNGAVVINTSRGEVIQTTALYRALESGKVSFAALDVVECENVLYEQKENKVDIESVKENCLKSFYVTNKLMNMKNVIITPHIAYNTFEAKTRILEITVENLFASLKFTNGAKNLVLI